jgi:hypothetical protein
MRELGGTLSWVDVSPHPSHRHNSPVDSGMPLPLKRFARLSSSTPLMMRVVKRVGSKKFAQIQPIGQFKSANRSTTIVERATRCSRVFRRVRATPLV